ncbi:hypothetical protein HETIRDRAFT_470386 [Heterobasidion irregulare TC 32-1]|uniref:Uncharacterized protein n=1 Tax=Heterobasidion irregulare (strain TC 32-1) TaxID=747525 RepID=W4KJB6_HETIT|nr:uncharacterized protein HETIRDRAFT_470386 [Heterobasidion irregulare TC 32-1]ETW85410.1 hypothetical protein HETIRDRAFT_470386 [Heterobasidion irregulare TC 32-1]
MAISMNEAQFLGLFLEAFMVGILCTLCCVIAFIQLRLPTHHSTGWLIPVTTLMLAIALIHFIVDFVRAYYAFVRLVPFYYLNFKNPLFLVKTVLLAVQTLVGDCVLVWRCYTIYNKRVWVIIIPLLFTIGGLVTTGANAAIWVHAKTTNRQDAALPWVTAYFSLTLAVNFYCTCEHFQIFLFERS